MEEQSGGEVIIGIDLGTWNSAAAILRGKEPEMIISNEGVVDDGKAFPSFVRFDMNGELLEVGAQAMKYRRLNPKEVIWGVKRLIGRSYNEVKEERKRFPYVIDKASHGGGVVIKVGKKEYTPTQICTMILAKIKKDAEADFNGIGGPIKKAVITIPAYFGPEQVSEIKEAAKQAGFQVKEGDLIPEPVAAAFVYGYLQPGGDQYVMCFDIGAGTLDITINTMSRGQAPTDISLREKSRSGDPALGGIDMDDALMKYVLNKHKDELNAAELTSDAGQTAILKEEIEKVKRELSSYEDASLKFTYKGKPIKITVTREELKEAIGEILEKCKVQMWSALGKAGIGPEVIDHLLLVGGPTKMPVLLTFIEKQFEWKETVREEIRRNLTGVSLVNPMECVAKGAAIKAGRVGRVTTVAPFGFGVLLSDGPLMLVKGGDIYPCSNSQVISSKDNRLSVGLVMVKEEETRQAASSDSGERTHKYISLGRYSVYFPGGTGAPNINVKMSLDKDMSLTTSLEPIGSGLRPAVYRRLDMLIGEDITHEVERLKESPPSPPPTEHPADKTGKPVIQETSETIWDEEDLKQTLDIAKWLADRVGGAIDQPTKYKLTETDINELKLHLQQLRDVMKEEQKDPNKRCPNIWNAIDPLKTQAIISGIVRDSEVRWSA